MGRYDMEIEEIRERIAQSDNVVFFGGAGVSTDRGIPDFRGSQGAYLGDCLVIINQMPTPYDGIADYVIQDSLADVLREIYEDEC